MKKNIVAQVLCIHTIWSDGVPAVHQARFEKIDKPGVDNSSRMHRAMKSTSLNMYRMNWNELDLK